MRGAIIGAYEVRSGRHVLSLRHLRFCRNSKNRGRDDEIRQLQVQPNTNYPRHPRHPVRVLGESREPYGDNLGRSRVFCKTKRCRPWWRSPVIRGRSSQRLHRKCWRRGRSDRKVYDRPEISIDRIDISLTAGQPDLEIIQQLEKTRAAEKKALKREADAAAVRAAYLAKLPLVRSGTPIAFIASDRRCAEQFQEAVTMEGLEKRKRLADLVAYGCGFIVDSPVHADLVQKQGGFALVKLANGNYAGKSGWVPASWVR
jgi:hypothetical protein